MDQREWDAGARLPRDRHATEARSTQNGPESPEKPQWDAIADTGSLQPSPEALAWTQRAEAWAQQPEDDEKPADPETPAVDGVGWRTETAEWMAAEQTARWRQTTEWRSASGDHGWRSTTEAWQTGANAEGLRPLADPATRQQLAISNTAWAADQPTGGPEPAQTYSAPPQTFITRGTPPGWQQFDPPDTRPAWQQFAAPGGTPPDRPPLESAPAAGTPSVDSAETVSNPPWQRAVPSPHAAAQPVDTANTADSPPWQQSVAMPAQRSGEGTSWQHLIEPARPTIYTSSGSAGVQNNGHRVRDEDPPVSEAAEQPWRTGAAGVDDGLVVGRRRAPEEERPAPAWEPADDPAGAPTWRDGSEVPGAHHADRLDRPEEAEPRTRHRSEAPRGDAEPAAPPPWQPDDSNAGWRDRSDGWRSETDSGSWSRGEEAQTVNWRRRRVDHVDDDTDAPGWRDAGPHTDGWRRDVRPAADPWAQHAADTGYIPMSWEQAGGTPAGSWRSDPEDRDEPEYRARRRSDDAPPLDPAVWRHGRERPGDGNWPGDEPENDDYREWPSVGEAATEVRQRVDPERWRPGTDPWQGEAARGASTYRGGNTGDWRRELAEESDLAEGEARRFGTQDFVPFRPAGSAPPPEYRAPERPGPVGRTNGPRWHEPPDSQWPPRGAVTGSYERRAAAPFSATSGRSNLLEPEDETEGDNGGPLAAVGYTVIWYGVPVILFLLYMLLATGDEKARALSTLANAAPRFGLALAVSMLVAVILRWMSGSWKAASVGLAAAVMGGGLATVLTSAITGNPLS